ncbi:ParB/RepB/Spo0J family partition protein [Streptomyces sp. NPDC004976]
MRSSSRLAAAREAGLSTIKVMVSDEQEATSEELLESALVANIHRQDLEELDEARALQRLLSIHGSQRALAKRLHRSQGWVSQRLALLNLTPELQARIHEEPIELLRAVGNRPHEEQITALVELKAERLRKEAEKQAAKTTHSPQPATTQPTRPETPDYDAITPPSRHPAPSGPATLSRGNTPSRQEAVPEPRTNARSGASRGTSADQANTPPHLPYSDPVLLARHLIGMLSDIELDKMLRILSDHHRTRNTSLNSPVEQ